MTKETDVTINGIQQKLRYVVMEGPDGISYEGNLRDLRFTIHRKDGQLRFTPVDTELTVIKSISAAVFDNEEQVSPDDSKN